MDEHKSLKKIDDTVWPPPPSASLPVPAAQEPFIVRLSLEMLILLDVGMGLATGGTHCLAGLLLHKQIYWQDTVFEAACMALTFFGLHLGLRYYFKKRHDTASSSAPTSAE